MNPIQLSVAGNEITVLSSPVVTAGTVGLPVEFQFDAAWENFSKTAVFRANGRTLDTINLQDTAVVPWELLTAPNCRLYIGVCGVREGAQMPTLWADLGLIQPGADPSGDSSADPTLPVWQQLTEDIEKALEGILNYQNSILDGGHVPGDGV